MNSISRKRACNAGSGWAVLLLTGVCLVCAYPAAGQDAVFDWVAGMGGDGDGSEESRAIAVDGSSNVYTTGRFWDLADFDPGEGTFNLTDPADYGVFVSKLDSSGSFVWAKAMGGANVQMGFGITVDGSGNVYAAGRFKGTADFDPGEGVANLVVPEDDTGIFIVKLDSAGDFLWAKSIGVGLEQDEVFEMSIAVDGLGNVYTAGRFPGPSDFDPGPGIVELAGDTFISKLDSNGNFVWAKALSSVEGLSMTLDASANVHVTGWFWETTDFDPGAGTSMLEGSGLFVLKLNSAGDFVWARGMNGVTGFAGRGIAVDGSGNVYTSGWIEGAVDFDPSPETVSIGPVGFRDIYVSKLNSSGNFVWVRTMGGNSDARGYAIALDGGGNVYTTGRFMGTVDFDPGPGTRNITADGVQSDAFISKLDFAGNFVWAEVVGGGDFQEGTGIAVSVSGGVHVTGDYWGTAGFDPGEGTFEITAPGFSSDIFVLKLSQGPATAQIVSDVPSGFIEVGTSTTLMLVGGAEAPFQWFKDGSPLVDEGSRVMGTDGLVLTFDPVDLGDSRTYHATYEDGGKAIAQTPPFELDVVPNVPLLGALGLALLAAMVLVVGFVLVTSSGVVGGRNQ